MISRQRPWGFMVALALMFALGLGAGFTGTAKAASEDVAMFYDDLSQYGQWVEYEKYGPVWRPNQVAEDWRPYTNGRWVPTNDGNVFESEEPWGWATYHYGNWMPTEGNGWVWVPGSTWYPSTVEWRTSAENEPVDNSYVGWAPTPPPDYVPPPSYAPPSYNQGAPVTDSLTSPLWIFVKAASFLLGFGQPYTPAYSYMAYPVFMPPAYVPVFFSRTMFIPAYATPTYYPPGFYGGRRFGAGYYNMGPSAAYLSRVTNINRTIINRTIINNSNRITTIRNVMPPERVMTRDGYIKKIMPPALVQGHRLPPPNPVKDFRMAQANLNKPNMVPPPPNVPRVTAQIPRLQPAALQPGRGLPGMALPARATVPLTPQMTQQIQNLPSKQQLVPAKGAPLTPGAAQPGQSGFQPGTHTQGAQGQPGVQTQPSGPQPGPVKGGKFHPGTSPSGTTPAKTGTVPLPPGDKGLTPEQRRQQEIEHQKLQHGGAQGQPQTQPQQLQKQQQLQQQQLQQKQLQQQQQHQKQLQQQQLQQQKLQQQPQQLQKQQQRQKQLQIQQQRQKQQQIQQQQQRQKAPPQQHQQPKKEEPKKKAPQQP